jgi:hypothetical protein
LNRQFLNTSVSFSLPHSGQVLAVLIPKGYGIEQAKASPTG